MLQFPIELLEPIGNKINGTLVNFFLTSIKFISPARMSMLLAFYKCFQCLHTAE